MHAFANESVHQPHRVHSSVLFWLVWAVIFLFAMAGAAATIGQEKSAAKSMGKSTNESNIKIVIAYSESDKADAPSIERSIRSQAADFDVDIQFYHVSHIPSSHSSQSNLGRSLLTSRNATVAFVIYSSESLVRLQILLKTVEGIEISHREVTVSGGTPMAEALGLIVRGTITTILNSGKQLVPPDLAEYEQKETKGQSIHLEKETTEGRMDSHGTLGHLLSGRLFMSAGAALGFMFAQTPPWVGMDLCVGIKIGEYVGVHFGYVVFSRVKAQVQDVNLTIFRHPFRLGVTLIQPFHRIILEGGLSIVWQYAVEQTSVATPDWTKLGDGAESGFSLAGFVKIGVPIHHRLALFGRLAADVLLYGPEYRIAPSQGEQVILKPLFVQHNIIIGVKFYFF